MSETQTMSLKRYFHENLGDLYVDYNELRVHYEKLAQLLGYNSDYVRQWFFSSRIPIRVAVALARYHPDRIKLEDILEFVHPQDNLKLTDIN